MNVSDLLIKFLLSVGLGALMGLERDGSWKHGKDLKDVKKSAENASKKFIFIKKGIPATSFGGVRTYILISLLGGIAGLAYSYGIPTLTWIIAISFVSFIVFSFILNYFDKNTFGLTTEISLIINFVLSLLLFATDISIKLIVAIAVLDVLVLSMKTQLRGVVSKFSGREVIDTIKFVLITSVVLPFMPNEFYSFGDIPVFGELINESFGTEFIEATRIFNPYQIFSIVVLVVGLNFVGYYASKAIGKDKSISVLALLGGLVSSTVVTEDMARRSKKSKSVRMKKVYLAATALTNLMSFIRVIFIVVLINFDFAKDLYLPLMTMSGALLVWFGILQLGKEKQIEEDDRSEKGFQFDSPFTLIPALRFGALYLGVIVVSEVSLYYLGSSGFIVSSMLASMTGLDAITVTTSTLIGDGINISLGVVVLITAACVNLLVKVLFAAISGDRYFRKVITQMFVSTILVGVISMLAVINL